MYTIRLFKSSIAAGLLITALAGCGKQFLDVKPKGKVIAEKISDYNNMLEQSLLNRVSSTSIFLDAQHILGDDVAGLEPQYSTEKNFGLPGTRRQNLFEWADEMYRADEDCQEVGGMYNRLYAVNKIINEVMDAKDGSLQLKEQYRAEARCQRAFAYFLLVNYYSRPYAEASAASDPGVPVVLKADFDQNSFRRSSVKEVYDLILRDLTESISFLPDIQTTANRFTKSAAAALLGKIYLFMGKADQAVPHLNDAVAWLPSRFIVSGNIAMMDYNTATVNNPMIGLVFTVPGMSNTTALLGHGYPETLLAQAVSASWLGVETGLICTPETYALYGASDRRRLLFSNTYSLVSPGPGPNLPAGLNRFRGGFIGNSIGIQLPELYLLRAEALARSGNIQDAASNLLLVRKNRMPLADAEAGIPATQHELIRFIIEERRREFAGLGFRWFDMRRLSNDPLFADQQTFRHVVYNADGSTKASYNLRPERWVLRFSAKLMSQSPGLINNP